MRTRRKFLPWLESWRRGSFIRGSWRGTQAAAPAGGKGEDLLLVPLGQWLWGQPKAPASQASAQSFLPSLFALDRYSFISFYTPLPAEGRAGTERALQHHLGSLKMPRAHPHSTFGNRDNVQTPILQHQALSTAEKEILCGAGEKNARGCELHRSNFIAVSSRRYIQPYFYAHT